MVEKTCSNKSELWIHSNQDANASRLGKKLTTVDCMPMPMLVRHIARLYRFLFRFDNH